MGRGVTRSGRNGVANGMQVNVFQ
jgi:hypothetical protein